MNLKVITPNVLKDFYNTIKSIFAKKDHTHPIDNELSGTSTNPVENNVVYDVMNNADIKISSEKYVASYYSNYIFIKGTGTLSGIPEDKTKYYLDITDGQVYHYSDTVDYNHPYVGWYNSGSSATTIKTYIDNKTKSNTVVNNLTSTTTGYMLDSCQGKVLDDKISELNASVNTNKSSIATAITNRGISTASSDSFEVMSTNIGNICTDTTGTDKSHILKNQTAYVKGNKVTGTMPSYKDVSIKYYGDVCNILCNDNLTLRGLGRCSLQSCTIENLTGLSFVLSAYTGYSTRPTISTYGDYNEHIRITNTNNNGYIQCFKSNIKTIDLTEIDKIVVTLDVYSSSFSGSTFLRGFVGLTDTTSTLSTSGEGSGSLSPYVYYRSTRIYDSTNGGERVYVIIDTSKITGTKYIGISMVHAGYLDIHEVVFMPKEQTSY